MSNLCLHIPGLSHVQSMESCKGNQRRERGSHVTKPYTVLYCQFSLSYNLMQRVLDLYWHVIGGGAPIINTLLSALLAFECCLQCSSVILQIKVQWWSVDCSISKHRSCTTNFRGQISMYFRIRTEKSSQASNECITGLEKLNKMERNSDGWLSTKWHEQRVKMASSIR